MDWRSWAYSKLTSNASVTAVVPSSFIFGSGSVEGKPTHRPFLVISFGVETPEFYDGDSPSAASQFMTLWAHDEPGDYLRIDDVLNRCRQALVGPALGDGAIFARWQGSSGDLADDTYGTIAKNSEYRLLGRK